MLVHVNLFLSLLVCLQHNAPKLLYIRPRTELNALFIYFVKFLNHLRKINVCDAVTE